MRHHTFFQLIVSIYQYFQITSYPPYRPTFSVGDEHATRRTRRRVGLRAQPRYRGTSGGGSRHVRREVFAGDVGGRLRRGHFGIQIERQLSARVL